MAVFTRVTHEEVQDWLADLACGELHGLEDIASGIENTNYFVTTSKGRYVLTIFEKLGASDLPFFLGFMQHLANKGLPVPGPIANCKGLLFKNLHGKPATLVNCLAGRSVEKATSKQCAAIGQFSAQAHCAALDFAGSTPNPRGLDWIEKTAQALASHLPEQESRLLEDEIRHQREVCLSSAYANLQKGAVHADLFKDNALMQGENLGGVIDFYFAGIDTFLFDLAVTANDWCINPATGEFETELLESLIKSYKAHRPFSDPEKQLWQSTLRAAALRFWTSRLFDQHMPREAEVLTVKDPKHFERVLRARREAIPFQL